MVEQKQTTSVREVSANFDLSRADTITSAFFDGINALGVGPAVTRIELYRVIDNHMEGDKAIEDRLVTDVLIIPTASVLAMATNLVVSLAADKGQRISQASDSLQQQILKAIDDIKKV